MRADAMLFCAGIALALLGGARSAAAWTTYPNHLPNGSASSCAWCHPGGDTTQRTPFGVNFENGAEQDAGVIFGIWANIRETDDADGDGVLSAHEIGDTCVCWTLGGAPSRTDDLSNPGDDANITTADPEAADCSLLCSAGAGEAKEHPPFEQGFCAVAYGPGAGGSSAGLAALLGAAAALLVGRRRAR